MRRLDVAIRRPFLERRRILGEIAEHNFLRSEDFRVGPVVAYPVAQAVLQVMVECRAACMIVPRPMPWLCLHACNHYIAETGDTGRLDPFAFDRIQGPQCLAQREGHGWTNLQDREVIPYQRGQR